MADIGKQSTVRWTGDDLAVLDALGHATGISNQTDILRLALRTLHRSTVQNDTAVADLPVLLAQRIVDAAGSPKKPRDWLIYALRTRGDAQGIRMRSVYESDGHTISELGGYAIGVTSRGVVDGFSEDFGVNSRRYSVAEGRGEVPVLAYQGGASIIKRYGLDELRSWAKTAESI